MTEPLKIADPAHLLFEFSKQEPAALSQAFAAVFASPQGQYVLLSILRMAGHGDLRKPLTEDERRYLDGQHDLALKICTLAGASPFSVALSLLSTTLEGTRDDRPRFDPRSYADAGPDPDADNAPFG